MAYEALNNLGALKSKVIIILNDNEMSIGESTGGLSRHLSKLRMSKGYLDFKKQVKSKLTNIPKLGKGLSTGIGYIKDSLKYAIVDGAFFEELGFKYFGPVDGHSIKDLTEIFELSKGVEEPVIIHVITKKGKGYKNAENNPERFHNIGPFDLTTGMPHVQKPQTTNSYAFGERLTELAGKDERIVAISAAMIDGTGLDIFKEKFPERIFDVGIAEEHAVTFAAGLAAQGFKPVVAIYSTFLQRAYDQIMSDVCLQGLPVIFAVDRAGNSGNDGPTHHGIFDLSYFSHMPGLTVVAPKDAKELQNMLDYAFELGSPCAIRYPKAMAEPETDLINDTIIQNGKSQTISTGEDVEIWALGSMAGTGAKAAGILRDKGYSVGLINARFMKPFDSGGLVESARRTKTIVTLEDNIITGGFGSQIANIIKLNNENVRLLILGWPEMFLEHGDTAELFRRYRLDSVSVAERIYEFIEGKA